ETLPPAGPDATLRRSMVHPADATPADALIANLVARIPPGGRDWLAKARAELGPGHPERLPAFFPQLPRRLGRSTLASGIGKIGGARLDLGVWRACDVGALVFLTEAVPDESRLLDLYHRGDLE